MKDEISDLKLDVIMAKKETERKDQLYKFVREKERKAEAKVCYIFYTLIWFGEFDLLCVAEFFLFKRSFQNNHLIFVCVC